MPGPSAGCAPLDPGPFVDLVAECGDLVAAGGRDVDRRSATAAPLPLIRPPDPAQVQSLS